MALSPLSPLLDLQREHLKAFISCTLITMLRVPGSSSALPKVLCSFLGVFKGLGALSSGVEVRVWADQSGDDGGGDDGEDDDHEG